MPRCSPTRRTAAALLSVLALAASSCGTDLRTDASSAPRPTTEDATASTTTTAAPAAAPSGREAVRRAADAPAHHGTATIDMSTVVDGEEVVRVRGTTSADGRDADLTMGGPEGEAPYLVVDGTHYFSLPGLPDGVEWVSMTEEEMVRSSGIDPSSAPATGTGTLEVLGEVADEVTELPGSELSGVPVRGYRARITSRELIVRSRAEGIYSEELAAQMLVLYPPSFHMDLWVDREGLPRRQEWTVEVAALPGGAPLRTEHRIDFTRWGAPLEVEAPPPSRVRSLTALQGLSFD